MCTITIAENCLRCKLFYSACRLFSLLPDNIFGNLEGASQPQMAATRGDAGG